MREKFIEQLQNLYRQMTVMGGLCQQAIAVAVKTLEEEEKTAEKLEAQVFALDGEVDDMEREISTLMSFNAWCPRSAAEVLPSVPYHRFRWWAVMLSWDSLEMASVMSAQPAFRFSLRPAKVAEKLMTSTRIISTAAMAKATPVSPRSLA